MYHHGVIDLVNYHYASEKGEGCDDWILNIQEGDKTEMSGIRIKVGGVEKICKTTGSLNLRINY